MTTVYISALIGELYSQHKDEDGFIYIMYSGENTFGSKSAVVKFNGASAASPSPPLSSSPEKGHRDTKDPVE